MANQICSNEIFTKPEREPLFSLRATTSHAAVFIPLDTPFPATLSIREERWFDNREGWKPQEDGGGGE